MKKFSFLILFIAVLFVCFPLFRPGFFVSDDGGWMIVRFSAFFQSLREGQFPVRFLGRLNFGYGYPVATFLYPGFMYIGSLIHVVGFSFVDTVKIIFGSSILVSTFFTFLWLKKYFSSASALVGALSFVFSPYLLFDMYRRGSVGEILAIAMASIGLYSIAAKKKWLLGLSVPLLILAHNSVALIFLGFFALYITFLREWRRFFVMFATGIGMATFFWFPALHEQKYVVFNSVAVANPTEHFISFKNAFLFGLPGVIALILSFRSKFFLSKEKDFFSRLFIILGILVTPLSVIIWQWTLLAKIIQFPYRFLSLYIFLAAWLVSYVAREKKGFIILFVGLGIISSLWHMRAIVYTNNPEGYYTTNEATTTVADEYMPKWVIQKPTEHAKERLLFYKGHGTILENKVSTQMIDVVVDADEQSEIQINTIYYPGWGATVDGSKVHIDYANNQSVMRIAIPAGKHHLVVSFRETITRFLADIVSLVSVILYFIFLI